MIHHCISLLLVAIMLIAPVAGISEGSGVQGSSNNMLSCILAIPNLKGPINGALVMGLRPYFRFSIPINFDGWAMFELSNRSDFQGAETIGLDLRNWPANQMVGFSWYKDLAPNHMYYWRVRLGCRDGSFTGPYTFPWSFSLTNSGSFNVPLLLQKDTQWGDITYGNYSSGDTKNTIARWGCNMTSAAMLINYWAIQQDSSFRTNPAVLNTWLRVNGGYDRNNGVIPARVVEYATNNGIAFNFNGTIGNRNDTILDSYLNSGIPVVIGVNKMYDSENNRYYPGHFVVATGKTTSNGTSTYAINDPVYGATTLADRYGNDYYGIRLYSGAGVGGRSARLSAHSPIELFLTDPNGAKTGFDPLSGALLSEIPNVEYVLETIQAADGSGELLPVSKVMYVNEIENGHYTLSIVGTGTGAYTVQNVVSDQNQRISEVQYAGVANTGNVIQEKFLISTSIGLVNNQVFLPIAIR